MPWRGRREIRLEPATLLPCLTIASATWTTSVSPSQGTLLSGGAGTVTVSVTVPTTAVTENSGSVTVQASLLGLPALSDDVPVPGDYDGDGLTDLAVYRRSTGVWLIRRSSDLGLTQQPWGSPALGDIPARP
jgi:hypothetical protein